MLGPSRDEAHPLAADELITEDELRKVPAAAVRQAAVSARTEAAWVGGAGEERELNSERSLASLIDSRRSPMPPLSAHSS